MLRLVLFVGVVLGTASCQHRTVPAGPPADTRPADSAGQTLRGPEAFAAIADPKQRSRAMFVEATRVFLHPRCKNCHPAGDIPHQGNALALHDPPVVRGPDDRGVVGMECTSCHQDRNAELARVPGAPGWHLAPRHMAWVDKSPHELCEQIKDPARNGGKTLAQIVDHNAHDELVGWGWAPGHGREPAPGNQQIFGSLVAAWVDTGAECPEESGR